MKRIALGIEYDGTGWRGWQTQPDGMTVQDQLEAAIRQFTRMSIATTCAGRTDAGVHASEQVVHLDTGLDRLPVSWVRGINSYLPASIAVRWACEVPGGKTDSMPVPVRWPAGTVISYTTVRSARRYGKTGRDGFFVLSIVP